jgi:CheY-like chemotaxis protein
MTLRYLVVDDSKLARMLIGKLLSELRPTWTQVEASSADQALAIIKSEKLEVVLLDVNMPGRSGLDVADYLQESLPNIPVAIVSANHQEGIVARAEGAGAFFLSKPVTKDALETFLGDVHKRLFKV